MGFCVAKDLTGQRSGKITVLRRWGTCPRGHAEWRAVCDCGKEIVVPAPYIVKQSIVSCGCVPHPSNRTHGLSKSKTYMSWRAMRERVNDPKNSHYQSYGGRGIKICPSWGSFENFLADMGERPEGRTLDREDTNGDYDKDNCRWATAKEQSRNTTRSVFIEFNGKRQNLSDWATEMGLTPGALTYRLANWPLEVAMTAPKDFTHSEKRYKGRKGKRTRVF